MAGIVNHKPPIVFGVPRSGSTLMFNIMDKLFEDVGGVDSQIHYFDLNPGKDEFLSTIKLSNKKVIATYRDFRNVLISYKQLFNPKADFYSFFERESCQHHIKKVKRSIECLQLLKENIPKEQILFLQYELFFENFDYIFDKIEYFYDTKFPSEKKEWITKEFDIKEGNEVLKKRMKGFTEDHITMYGKTDWKLLDPKQDVFLHKVYDKNNKNDVIRKNLELWGYEI